MRRLIQSLENTHRVWIALGFLYAVFHLFLLRNADLSVVVLFLVPPSFACLILASPIASRSSRIASRLFLGMVAAAIVLGEIRAFLPNMRRLFPGVPQEQDRVLTFYVGVYLLFLLGFLPPYLFVASLRQHARGEAAAFSRPTCYLGMVTWTLIMLVSVAGIPRLLRAMF